MRKKVKICLLAVGIIIVMTVLNAASTGSANSSDSSTEKLISVKEEDNNITFDFPKAKLDLFARFVAKISGKILIGEQLLKSEISIKTESNLSLREVKKLFRIVLNNNGLDFTENKLFIEIIPRSNSIVKVYKIKYLKSADLAKSLTQMFRMSFNTGEGNTNIQISSVDSANSIMVLAPKSQQVDIEQSINELDIRVRQVMLNMLVLEVTKTSQFGFGMDVLFNDNSISAGLTSGGGSSGTPMTFTTEGTGSAGGITYQKGNWYIDVQGMDNKTKIKVLQQPKIMAADNIKAQVKIGIKQPFITTTVSIGSTTDSNSNATTSSTISTEDVGINIDLVPRINNVKNVTLDIKLNISSISGEITILSNGVGTQIPNVGHKIIESTSNVISGEVLVMGGLLKNQKTIITKAPPIIGDIPLIGWMFAKESEVSEQTELMIFISPTIIYNSDEGDAVTINETNKLRNYDLKTKGDVDQMLTKKPGMAEKIFNFFDYFSDGKYRSEQDFIAQPEGL